MVKDKYKEICFRGAFYSNRIWKPDRPGSNVSSTNYSWPSVSTVVEHRIQRVNNGTCASLDFDILSERWKIRCRYDGMTRLTMISGKLFHLFNPVSSSAKQMMITTYRELQRGLSNFHVLNKLLSWPPAYLYEEEVKRLLGAKRPRVLEFISVPHQLQDPA